jgi:hypothetical protein
MYAPPRAPRFRRRPRAQGTRHGRTDTITLIYGSEAASNPNLTTTR